MPTPDGALWRDIYYTSCDDLRLHARHYPAARGGARPAVCLPGLSRTGRDFHDLAVHLATDPVHPRDVYTVDYRGRGQSAFDPDWENYTQSVELDDTLDLMAIEAVHHAAIIGTSRGGLIAMSMAVRRPTAIGLVVLNDIGPVIETRGLLRITSYVGKLPLPRNWADAATLMREIHGRAFPAIEERQWAEIAHACFNEKHGAPAEGYDPALARTLVGIDLSRPLPALWGQFTALTPFPALVLRGANSDLLSADTVAAMVSRHPNMHSLTVPGQGHAPMLKDSLSIETIARFLAAND
jgi:pimeloyl-ACP methyl ester carboxylesterase